MSKPRGSLRRAALLLLVPIACVGAVSLGLLAGAVPDLIGRLGSPGPALEPAERVSLSAYLLLNLPQLERPVNPEIRDLTFAVEEGETADGVARRLEERGLISNHVLLTRFLRYRGMDRGIEAGRYQLSGTMNLRELATALQSAEIDVDRLTVPEGWRTGQIADALEGSGGPISAEGFLEATSARPGGYSFSSSLPPDGGLEGFLFPDTYQLDDSMTAVDLVGAMLNNFENRVTQDLRSGFEAQELTLYEAVTLASIVEREAAVAEERPRIASVFLNRLALGMPLEADPTVQYALGRQPDGDWWKSPLTAVDLELDSPFNTYRYKGLPPTPITNPGLASLEAVAQPEETLFLYFRAACDGSGRHQFAVTYEEHVANACP